VDAVDRLRRLVADCLHGFTVVGAAFDPTGDLSAVLQPSRPDTDDRSPGSPSGRELRREAAAGIAALTAYLSSTARK
jgi:hypothetical protein